MSSRLNKKAYESLIQEDLEWLMKQPKSLERDHIKIILEHAVSYEYDNKKNRNQ